MFVFRPRRERAFSSFILRPPPPPRVTLPSAGAGGVRRLRRAQTLRRRDTGGARDGSRVLIIRWYRITGVFAALCPFGRTPRPIFTLNIKYTRIALRTNDKLYELDVLLIRRGFFFVRFPRARK